MSKPVEPQRHFLERATSWLVSLRRLLMAPGWNVELARQVARGLAAIEDYARNRRYDAVITAVEGLRLDWERLRVVESAPDDAARDLLRARAHALVKAVAAVGVADAASLGLPVYALLPERETTEIVTQDFAAQGMHLQVFREGDALADALASRRPEAILVETQLGDGLAELLDRLSPTLPGISQLPIVALASAGDAHPRLNAALAGSDLYAETLDDPLLASRIRHLLADYSRDPYRVLIVDDDRATGMLSCAILERTGFKVALVHDADSARATLQTSSPDLILMDLELPGESGLALTASLRDGRGASVLPIVFLSGDDSEDVRFQALRAGGDDFLIKPIRPRHLISMARSRIKRARALGRQLRARTTAERGHLRRGAFLEHLRVALEAATNDFLSLIVISIDDTDTLQNKLGVVRSHELERAIVDRINRCLANTDVYCLLDDFQIALLAERSIPSALTELARDCVRAVGSEDFFDAGQCLHLTASAGMAKRPLHQADLERWLQLALGAMRTAHEFGGDRVEGSADRLLPGVPPERQLRIRALLNTATRTDWRVDYRPHVPLRSDQVHQYGGDVLLRDSATPLGGILRDEYIDTAREMGVIEAWDRQLVISQVELLREYADHGHPIDLSVMIEASSLAHLRAELGALAQSGSGAHLVLELDVDTAMDEDTLVSRFGAWRLPGVSLGVYDGSGRFGHWPALLALPLARIRIPAAALIDGGKAAEAMVQRWRAMGRSVTACDVSSPGLLSTLWALGVDHVAGDGIALVGSRPDFDFAAFAA